MSNKALKEHPPEPLSKSEWISVCDRLPETEANVLAVTEDYPVRMVVPAKYDGIDWCDIENTDRISELRKEGHPISTKMITVVNRYGEKVRVAEWFM
jgi:hypothetical protein